jgi:hypothetical protein
LLERKIRSFGKEPFPVIRFNKFVSHLNQDTDIMEFQTTFHQFLLSCLFFVIFCISQYRQKSDLNKFYDRVSQDPLLEQKLESIIKQEDFLEQMVALGISLGYKFTILEVKDAIAIHTPKEQNRYICLPIGCWQITD